MNSQQMFLLEIIQWSVGVGAAAILGATIVASIVFWRTKDHIAEAYVDLLQRGNLLQMITVMFIVYAVFFLRVLDLITSEAVVSVMSGIAGYVLGGIHKARSVKVARPTD